MDKDLSDKKQNSELLKTISKLYNKIKKLEAEQKGIEFEICEKNKFFERMFNVDGRTFDDIDESM